MNTFTIVSAVDYSTGIANIGKCALEDKTALKKANKNNREGDKIKLFEVSTFDHDCHDNFYLTVENNDDTEKSIEDREQTKQEDTGYYIFDVSEITEVNGHKIRVEE